MQRVLARKLRTFCRCLAGAHSHELPPHLIFPRIHAVDPKKIPSSREYQLLAVLVRSEWTGGKGAELNGRQIAKAYEKEADETIPYGTVYTLLGAMEESAWVRSREDLHEGRRTRWYRINKKGIDAVERWRKRSSLLLNLTTPPPRKRSKSTTSKSGSSERGLQSRTTT